MQYTLLLAIMDENVVQLLRASPENTALIQNRINCVCQKGLEVRIMDQLYKN